jgi:hypothetical protein
VPIKAGAVEYGHPFITARQLISVTANTALRAPALLGEVLLQQLPPAPYCPECRRTLPAKHQAEQMKIMVVILVILALIAALVWALSI